MSSYTFDSNILVYSFDSSSPVKQVASNRIVQSVASGALPIPLQCLTEFYAVVTRKGHMPASLAESVVHRFLALPNVQAAGSNDVIAAIVLQQSHKIQFFDALLLATAARSGCTTFFSEDFQHGRAYNSLTVRNPFQMSEDELSAVLA